eukprot:15767002-Heterocapsa_arctica.AAC.1
MTLNVSPVQSFFKAPSAEIVSRSPHRAFASPSFMEIIMPSAASSWNCLRSTSGRSFADE